MSAGVNGRCQTDANNTDLPASNPPSVSDIQNYLNDRWGTQANVHFTVNTSIQEIKVNYDLDRDRKLQTPSRDGQSDFDEIDAMKQSQPSETINMYWVGVDLTDLTVLGIGSPGHSWFATNTLQNQSSAMFTIAHEIGHALGRGGHTSESITALEYQRDLMYFSLIDAAQQCRVRRGDWDLVNKAE